MHILDDQRPPLFAQGHIHGPPWKRDLFSSRLENLVRRHNDPAVRLQPDAALVEVIGADRLRNHQEHGNQRDDGIPKASSE